MPRPYWPRKGIMSKITRSAKGKHCTLRVSGYGGCSDPETVVFCHAPSSGKGVGKKSPDWWGAFGCSKCHDIVDGRAQYPLPPRGQVDQETLDKINKLHPGWIETQDALNEYSDKIAAHSLINTAWLRAIYETHQILIEEGLIQVAA